MNPNRPLPAGYPPVRGYGIDPPRLISPYRAPGYMPYYPPPQAPPLGPSPASAGSPFRVDSFQSAERRDTMASTNNNMSSEYDEIAGSSEEESPVATSSKHTKDTAGGANRAKKRSAPQSLTGQSRAPVASSSKAPRKSNSDAPNTPEDGQSNSNPAKRKKAVSCEGCRRRKLKCDRGWPCGACRDRDEAHLCSWEGGTRPQGTGRDQDNAPLLTRMEKMESLLSQIANKIGLGDTSSQPFSSSSVRQPPMNVEKQDPNASSRPVPNATQSKTQKSTTSLLATGWKATTEAEAIAELCDIMDMLPDTQTLRKMCQYFFDEVGYMQYAVDEDDFWQQLRGHEELRMMSSGSLMHSRLVNKDNVRHHLQFLAVLLGVCGLADLFSNEPEFANVSKAIGMSPVYGPFFDAAHRALNASNPFEEPTINSLRVLLLLIWGLASVRGPAVCVALFSLAVNQVYALELDIEPTASMPKAQARDRIRLYHAVVIMDWLGAGTMKKGYIMREEPIKHPYLFGRQNVKEGLLDKDGFMMPDMWLKLELARINRRACDRVAMNDEDAYSTTLTLQQELDEVFSDLPQEFESELFIERSGFDFASLHRLGVLMMVANQLINLHKRYYIQGWLDPVYRTSRDICFSSARRICLIFRKMFSVIVPMDKLMAMDLEQITKVMDGHQMINSRLWFFAHSSVGACLLLQHHYALMDVHPDAAGPNAERVRKEIIDDLRYTRRLLFAMSTRSQVAKSGIAVLARPELACSGGAQSTTFSHAYTGHQHKAASHERDDESARRAELARDLQSITDHDTFASKRHKADSDSTMPFRGRRHRPTSSTEASHPNGTPRSTTGTPSSVSHSVQGYPNNATTYNGGSSSTNSMVSHSENTQPSRQFAIPGQPQQTTQLQQQPQSQQQQKSAPPGWSNGNNMSASELEALLESALSTDLTTGMPLPPEASFERQADRIGGFALPTAGMLGSGPMSPFTSAFLGSWDFQASTTSSNSNVPTASASMPIHSVPVNGGGSGANTNNWF